MVYIYYEFLEPICLLHEYKLRKILNGICKMTFLHNTNLCVKLLKSNIL